MASKVGPAVTITPRQQLGLQRRDHLVAQLGGLQHAAVANLAARLVATARPEHQSTIGLDARHVALRGGVGPHLAVHRRCHQQQTALARPRQTSEAQQIVGLSVGEFGDEVGRSGCHDQGVGGAREADVCHRVGLARIPLAGEHRAPAQRLHGDRGDERFGRLRHHHLHGGAGFDQLTGQFGGLVAGDAAAQTQHDVAAVEVQRFGHGAQCSSVRWHRSVSVRRRGTS
jgi:hypothetical protein